MRKIQRCGSGMFISDPGSDFFPYRIWIVSIPNPGSASQKLKYFYPIKWFLSSRKYDPGCSFQIPDPDPDFLPIPDPGCRGHRIPDPGPATLEKYIMKFWNNYTWKTLTVCSTLMTGWLVTTSCCCRSCCCSCCCCCCSCCRFFGDG